MHVLVCIICAVDSMLAFLFWCSSIISTRHAPVLSLLVDPAPAPPLQTWYVSRLKATFAINRYKLVSFVCAQQQKKTLCVVISPGSAHQILSQLARTRPPPHARIGSAARMLQPKPSTVSLRHEVAAAAKQRRREALPPGRGGKIYRRKKNAKKRTNLDVNVMYVWILMLITKWYLRLRS